MNKASKDPAKQPRKSRKVLKISLAIIVALIVTGVVLNRIGRAQQAKITDGTENYSGVKQEVAKNALERLRGTDISRPVAFYDLLRVEDVRPTTQDEVKHCASDVGYSADPTNVRHYTVVVSNRVQFGIKVETILAYGCREAY